MEIFNSEAQVEFDDSTQEVIWDKGSQRIKRESAYLFLKLLFEKQGVLTFAEIKSQTTIKGISTPSTVVGILKKELKYTFPYEILTVVKEGYWLIPKQKMKTEYST